ncbi:hypothetical protein HNR21_001025 [Actinomadura cellulosilytica]|uniref:Uncharacterized protein n=1 Tax=Thermomonospora cellulosilytica TaxID=1411118 RepID=A0A7W3R6G7_9ACTN|nr:hypothetical protein [Thermomonospora cellulosilytica]
MWRPSLRLPGQGILVLRNRSTQTPPSRLRRPVDRMRPLPPCLHGRVVLVLRDRSTQSLSPCLRGPVDRMRRPLLRPPGREILLLRGGPTQIPPSCLRGPVDRMCRPSPRPPGRMMRVRPERRPPWKRLTRMQPLPVAHRSAHRIGLPPRSPWGTGRTSRSSFHQLGRMMFVRLERPQWRRGRTQARLPLIPGRAVDRSGPPSSLLRRAGRMRCVSLHLCRRDHPARARPFITPWGNGRQRPIRHTASRLPRRAPRVCRASRE